MSTPRAERSVYRPRTGEVRVESKIRYHPVTHALLTEYSEKHGGLSLQSILDEALRQFLDPRIQRRLKAAGELDELRAEIAAAKKEADALASDPTMQFVARMLRAPRDAQEVALAAAIKALAKSEKG